MAFHSAVSAQQCGVFQHRTDHLWFQSPFNWIVLNFKPPSSNSMFLVKPSQRTSINVTSTPPIALDGYTSVSCGHEASFCADVQKCSPNLILMKISILQWNRQKCAKIVPGGVLDHSKNVLDITIAVGGGFWLHFSWFNWPRMRRPGCIWEISGQK